MCLYHTRCRFIAKNVHVRSFTLFRLHRIGERNKASYMKPFLPIQLPIPHSPHYEHNKKNLPSQHHHPKSQCIIGNDEADKPTKKGVEEPCIVDTSNHLIGYQTPYWLSNPPTSTKLDGSIRNYNIYIMQVSKYQYRHYLSNYPKKTCP